MGGKGVFGGAVAAGAVRCCSSADQLLKDAASVRSRGRMTLCWPWLSLLPSLAASALPMHADYRPSADGRAIETESPSGRYFNRPL